jgi:hypothetical protein
MRQMNRSKRTDYRQRYDDRLAKTVERRYHKDVRLLKYAF